MATMHEAVGNPTQRGTPLKEKHPRRAFGNNLTNNQAVLTPKKILHQTIQKDPAFRPPAKLKTVFKPKGQENGSVYSNPYPSTPSKYYMEGKVETNKHKFIQLAKEGIVPKTSNFDGSALRGSRIVHENTQQFLERENLEEENFVVPSKSVTDIDKAMREHAASSPNDDNEELPPLPSVEELLGETKETLPAIPEKSEEDIAAEVNARVQAQVEEQLRLERLRIEAKEKELADKEAAVSKAAKDVENAKFEAEQAKAAAEQQKAAAEQAVALAAVEASETVIATKEEDRRHVQEAELMKKLVTAKKHLNYLEGQLFPQLMAGAGMTRAQEDRACYLMEQVGSQQGKIHSLQNQIATLIGQNLDEDENPASKCSSELAQRILLGRRRTIPGNKAQQQQNQKAQQQPSNTIVVDKRALAGVQQVVNQQISQKEQELDRKERELRRMEEIARKAEHARMKQERMLQNMSIQMANQSALIEEQEQRAQSMIVPSTVQLVAATAPSTQKKKKYKLFSRNKRRQSYALAGDHVAYSTPNQRGAPRRPVTLFGTPRH
eukprot:m.31360 g.31360  ORF g.31360 m.31360 type:complete len:550 (+) comp8308_c0_seq3:104-1753(+)